MNKVLLAISLLMLSILGFSQPCTPNAPTGSPGVFPDPDNVPCIERNVPYDFTMQTENFDSITLNVQFLGSVSAAVLWTQIDSIENFPCGISWESDSLLYSPGETGCIRVSGTTKEIVGQYPVKIYITMNVDIPNVGPQTISGELNDLANQGGVSTDYRYVSRVINQGDPCPTRDTLASGVVSDSVCPALGVDITGAVLFCQGSSTLTAVPKYEVGSVSYLWAPNGETTSSISVSTSGTYSVTVTDQTGTASTSVGVNANQGPTAAFTSVASGLDVDFTSTSTLADSYSWDFGDGGSSTAQDPSHTYAADSTYTVTLTATNNCGSDIATDNVTVVTPPCIANAPTGTPGITPSPDSVSCVERNTPYDFTMQVENFDTLTLNTALGTFDVAVTFTHIDSVGNLPCGLSWAADKVQYAAAETGCIRVSGTSREIPGQYPVKIYLTMGLDVPFLGAQTISGELNTELIPQLESLAGPLGYDFKYVSRVIQAGTSCPARDITSEDVASGDVCPSLRAVINGSPVLCSGNPTTLTAVAQYETGTVTYAWSGGETTAAITAFNAGNYIVTVTDQNGNAVANVSVTTGSAPTAGFTTSTVSPVVSVINTTSGGATSYNWNWGDNSAASTAQTPPPHTYTSNGVKTIRLIASNSCGADTTTSTVTITGVGIDPVENNIHFSVYPNPSSGRFSFEMEQNGDEQTELSLYDLTGKLLYTETIKDAGDVKKELDFSTLPKGIYALHLNSKSGNGIQKLAIY